MTIQIRTDYGLTGPSVQADTFRASKPKGVYRLGFKRLFDICFVMAISVPSLLVIALLALIIARDGHNPFYMQERVGRNGRVFKMWKLRTMVQNADTALADHLKVNVAAQIEWDRHQKLAFDPRITPIGRFLRATSIDELPQFFNVLKGDMSIVGPRPMMTNQQSLYPGIAYYEMRPGITGLWQISERNLTSFSERAVFDNAYFGDMSFRTDLRVVLRTVLVVVRANGQ